MAIIRYRGTPMFMPHTSPSKNLEIVAVRLWRDNTDIRKFSPPFWYKARTPRALDKRVKQPGPFGHLRSTQRLHTPDCCTGEDVDASSRPEDFDEGGPDLVRSLHNHWVGEYIGPSCMLLRERNTRVRENYPKDEHYAKSILFVQSSGIGRSRLADSYGTFKHRNIRL